MRKELGIADDGSKVEIKATENEIIIRRYEPACVLCRGSEDLLEFNGMKICRKCACEISKL